MEGVGDCKSSRGGGRGEEVGSREGGRVDDAGWKEVLEGMHVLVNVYPPKSISQVVEV